MTTKPAGRPKKLLTPEQKLERYKDDIPTYTYLKDQLLREHARKMKIRTLEPDLESKVERYFVREIRRLGGLCLKWVCQGRKGLPDRIVFFKGGHVLFCELKMIDGKLSKSQEREIARLEKLGTKVHVLYGKRGVNKFMLDVVLQDVPAAIKTFKADADKFYYEVDYRESLEKESYDF